jgi:fumarate reductase subunit D
MVQVHRNHPSYWAFVVHRLSGLALSVFLPVHLYVLGLALAESSAFADFISWSNTPALKALETLLVIMLSAHLTGGLRLLGLEFLDWRQGQKTLVAVTGGLSLCVGLVFLLNAY